MIRLELHKSEKLAVIWIINPRVLLYSKPNLRCDLFYFDYLLINLYI